MTRLSYPPPCPVDAPVIEKLRRENERLKKANETEGKARQKAWEWAGKARRAAFKRAEHLVAQSLGLPDAMKAIRAEAEKP